MKTDLSIVIVNDEWRAILNRPDGSAKGLHLHGNGLPS